MGLLSKLKNIFYDIEEVEIKNDPSKDELGVFTKSKEVKQPEIKKEIIKDDMEDIISERELFKSETTFKFPVIFEDEDFMTEKKQNKHTNIMDFENTKIKEKQKKEEKALPKSFRVSPIISPVYGVLDKNYKKEDITSKNDDLIDQPTKEIKIDFDMVRKKAYGTLADELETSLENDDNRGMFFNLKSEKKEKPIDEDNLLYDMSEKNEDIIVENISATTKPESYLDFGLEYNIESSTDKDFSNKDKDDSLFDLIDSMYNDSNDEEEK